MKHKWLISGSLVLMQEHPPTERKGRIILDDDKADLAFIPQELWGKYSQWEN